MTQVTCRLTAKNRRQFRTLRSAVEYGLIVSCRVCRRAQNDALLRLPSQTSAEGSCLPCHGGVHVGGSGSDDGPEEVMTGDDYVRQRLAALGAAAAARPPSSAGDQQPSAGANSPPSVVRWRSRRRQTSVRAPLLSTRDG